VTPAKGSRAKPGGAKSSTAKSPPAKPNRAGGGAAGADQGDATSLVVLNPAQLTLLPRPEPPAEALAAIVAAAQLLWARPAAAPEESRPALDAWRFSGRWWAQPALVRRARPWARP
jgi:hypothetical protein